MVVQRAVWVFSSLVGFHRFKNCAYLVRIQAWQVLFAWSEKKSCYAFPLKAPSPQVSAEMPSWAIQTQIVSLVILSDDIIVLFLDRQYYRNFKWYILFITW